jgi:hypothetical protein
VTPTSAVALSAKDAGWRREARAGASPVRRSWVPFAVLATPVVGVTVLSKFTIPPLGSQGLDISLFLVLGAVLIGSFAQCVRIHAARLGMYVSLIAILGLMQSLQPDSFSINSMLLLTALHLPYVFTVTNAGDGERIIRFFLNIATVAAFGAIAQYALQFVTSSHVLFPIENFAPPSMVVQHYNSQAALAYGSEVYRPNGIFMLEPSFLSQLVAVGIVAELCTRVRLTRLALFAVALVVSFSGTGVLVLLVCIPAFLIAKRRWNVLIAGCAVLAILIALQDVLPLGRFIPRIGEFSSTKSSGFARFIGGFYMFDQYLWTDPWRTLFGYGAGSFMDYSSHARMAVAEMALFKIVFEFGLVGATLYFGFLFGCLYTSRAPGLLVLGIGVTYLLNGMYASFAHGLALGLLLWNSSRVREPAPATSSKFTSSPLAAVGGH